MLTLLIRKLFFTAPGFICHIIFDASSTRVNAVTVSIDSPVTLVLFWVKAQSADDLHLCLPASYGVPIRSGHELMFMLF